MTIGVGMKAITVCHVARRIPSAHCEPRVISGSRHPLSEAFSYLRHPGAHQRHFLTSHTQQDPRQLIR